MKVQNMTGRSGKPVANQFVLDGEIKIGAQYFRRCFQSYNSIICAIGKHSNRTYLDAHYWDYSTTTGKYRNQFLGEGIADTRKKINSGEYILADLN